MGVHDVYGEIRFAGQITLRARAEDRPEYAWLREYKAAHGEELRQRYGAHSIGIGWKRTAERKTQQLALLFYVYRKHPNDEVMHELVPPNFTFTPKDSDAPVVLITDVIETPPAEFE